MTSLPHTHTRTHKNPEFDDDPFSDNGLLCPTIPPLWRQMQISALAAPASPDGPAHRFASMLNVVAGYLNKHGYQDAALLLLDEADLANNS